MVLSIKYSTILNKREVAHIEYPAIGATSFVSIVVYLTCTIMLTVIIYKINSRENSFV